MIQVTGLFKELGSRILFNEITFTLNKNERLGLVGRNGCGKSTLFKMITGKISIDGGEISVPKNYSIGYLEQHIAFSKKTVIDECMQVLSKEEEFDNYKAEKILFGLGFSEEDLLKDPHSFSGGYQIRINLTKILLQSPNLLLLDEPTNYLDIISIRWLEKFLSRYPGEIILITHDRDFMQNVCNHTMAIHRQKLTKIQGSYQKLKEKIELEESVYENTRLNQEKKRKEIEAFVERFKAKASKANQAQSRLKMLEKMEEIEALENVKSLDFKFNYKSFMAKSLCECTNLSFAYPTTDTLFKDLSFYINKGEKIAIIGKNGKGKSTLLNLLSQKLNPVDGEIHLHNSVSIGHFGQTNISVLHPENTIEQEIQSVNAQVGVAKIRSICATMMFTGDDAKKKVKVLSGGEKSRVLLGKILAKETNLLLLDEPTNHLDQESINALSEQIVNFEGAAVIVTHNEYMLRKIASKFIIFHEDNCFEFIGSYDDFLTKVGWQEESENLKETEVQNQISHKEYKHLRSELIKERSRAVKPLKIEIEKIESSISECEKNVEDANNSLIKASEDDAGDEIVKYSKILSENEQKIEDLFEQLEEDSNKLMEIEDSFEQKLVSLESLK